jgi:hypothetical protein
MRRLVLAIAATIVLAGCGGHGAPAGQRRASLGAGISIAVPRGWHAAGSRITALVYPVDRLLLTSYRARRGGNCAPDRAEQELPANGVLAYLFEYRPRVGKVWPSSFRRSEFPQRPAHFKLSRRAFGHFECWRVASYVIRFRAAGRPFQLHVAFGPRAGAVRRAALLRALDSLRIARIAPPPPDPYAGWHGLVDETGDTLRTPPGWLAAGMASPRRQAQPRTLFVTANRSLPGLPERRGPKLRALPRRFPQRMLRGFPPDGVVLWIREERPGRPVPRSPRFHAARPPLPWLELFRAGAGGRGTRFSLRILVGPTATALDRRRALQAARAFGYSVGSFRNRACRRVCESGAPVHVIPAQPPPVSAADLEEGLRANPDDPAQATCRAATRADRLAARSFAGTRRLFICSIALRGEPAAVFDVQVLANGCFVAERRRRGQADYGCIGAPAARQPFGILYLAGVQPGQLTTVDVARDRVMQRRLPELAQGDPPHMIDVVGGRLVIYGRDHTYALDPASHSPARDLGTSWFFLPSATPGRVWLALLDPHSPQTVNALAGVREVTLDGVQTRASPRRPPRWPLAALRSGLVMQGKTLQLWDPASGRITQRLPGVFPVAARDWRLVSCAAGCRVMHVSDTLTGTRGVIEPPPGARFTESYDGAFSPDGRLVAVPALDGRGTPRVAIVDLARRTARLVRGPRLARDYQLMAWSQSGWLFYNAGHGRLAAYNPSGVAARLLAVHVDPFVDIAAR